MKAAAPHHERRRYSTTWRTPRKGSVTNIQIQPIRVNAVSFEEFMKTSNDARVLRNKRASQRRRERIAAMSPEQREEKRRKEREYSRRRRAQFPDEVKAILQRSRAKRKAEGKKETLEQRRIYHIKSKYGVPKDEWDRMFAKQGYCCAICKSPTSKSSFFWATDHCHTTGKVRGILCHPCNAIVHKHATPQILRRAADYLENP